MLICQESKSTNYRVLHPPVRAFIFAMIQDLVWIYFFVSDSKFHYMGGAKIKFSTFKLQHMESKLRAPDKFFHPFFRPL